MCRLSFHSLSQKYFVASGWSVCLFITAFILRCIVLLILLDPVSVTFQSLLSQYFILFLVYFLLSCRYFLLLLSYSCYSILVVSLCVFLFLVLTYTWRFLKVHLFVLPVLFPVLPFSTLFQSRFFIRVSHLFLRQWDSSVRWFCFSLSPSINRDNVVFFKILFLRKETLFPCGGFLKKIAYIHLPLLFKFGSFLFLLNGISDCVGYLMLKPSLKKNRSDAI